MTDPIPAIAGAYAALGLPMSDEARTAMHAFLASRPQGMHGKHNYKRAGEIEEVQSDERRKYKRYQEYFNVPNEG